MAKTRPFYRVGEKGVNVVASPLHTPDGGLLSSQNVEFIRDLGIGGIGSRGGLAPLNGTALAGAVLSAATIPLVIRGSVVGVEIVPGLSTLMVPCDTGETETFKKTVDGSSYTDVLAAVASRMSSIAKFPDTITPATIAPTQRMAVHNGKLYFAGDDFIISDTVSPFSGNTPPPLLMFDGSATYEQVRMSANPQATGPCRWITDMLVAQGVIFIAVYDLGGVAPDLKGRVLSFNPDTGELTQIGVSPFGSSAVPNGMPFCMATFAGQLWVGTYGTSAAGLGRIYRINISAGVGVDFNWTVDKTALASSGYFMSLCEYNGNLYAASNASDAGFTARVEKRTQAGTWSTSFSGPDTGASYCSSLIVFNSLLFAAYFKDTVRVLVKVFDGTTWTTDKDVGVDFSNLSAVPGQPFIYRDNLYWPFTALTAAAQTGFILKRTTGGTWSKVLDLVSLRGLMGTYLPAAS